MTDFRNKYGPWTIVAGASEELGAACAEALVKRGLNVILVAQRRDLLDALATRLAETWHIETMSVPLDLADHADTHVFLDILSVDVGLLVYNAAFAPIAKLVHVEREDLQRVVDISVTAPLLLVRSISEKMLARCAGGIVLMSSLPGAQGSPRIATIAALKAFNTILAEGLWAEMKDGGVDVLSSCADSIRTPRYLATGSAEAPGALKICECRRGTGWTL